MLTTRWPDDFDDYAWEVEAKGWFEGIMVEWNGRHIRPVFYDPVRLGQEIADTFARGEAYFREPNLIVVQATTRDYMQSAVEGLSDEELEHLVAE
jgi:hypothetical protein